MGQFMHVVKQNRIGILALIAFYIFVFTGKGAEFVGNSGPAADGTKGRIMAQRTPAQPALKTITGPTSRIGSLARGMSKPLAQPD